MSSLVAGTICVGCLALSGCSSHGKSGPSAPAPTSPAPAGTSSAGTSASSTGSTAAGGTGAVAGRVAVNKSFANPAMGESGTVLAYVRHFPLPASTYRKDPGLHDAEIVLVQVKVQSSTKYYDSFGSGSFSLIDGTGQENGSTSVIDAQMSAAGYAPLKDATDGATTTGWIAFTPGTGATAHLTVEYKGLAATGSDGTAIPARNVKIKLV
jgi:hypothetical protein